MDKTFAVQVLETIMAAQKASMGETSLAGHSYSKSRLHPVHSSRNYENYFSNASLLKNKPSGPTADPSRHCNHYQPRQHSLIYCVYNEH